MYILSSKQMQDADSHAINELGIPSIVLMENACRSTVSVITEHYPKRTFKNVIVISGKGNNGGDGIGVARILAENGYTVNLLLLTTRDSLKNDPLINFNIYKKLNYKYTFISNPDELSKIIEIHSKNNTIIVDAIFGTGITKPVTDSFYLKIFTFINQSKFNTISIDIPSGLSDKFIPKKNTTIIADLTISLQSLKTAHLYPDGNKICGKLVLKDIGIPSISIEKTNPKIRISNPEEFGFLKEKRILDKHKGDFGFCLNISGSKEKPGAAILSSIAILKSGAGLCTVAVQPENRDIIINALPELMTNIYSNPEELKDIIKKSDIILSGPGMGTGKLATRCLEIIFKNAFSPLILDADAINIISENPEFLKNRNKKNTIILTPHPGEFAKLTGKNSEYIKKNRISLSSEFAQKNNVYLVLKGHHSIIASPNGNLFINQSGNPGMATAGSGDVLSGIITGLMAQFFKREDTEKILAASIFLHGYAGDIAKKRGNELSMTATDIIKYLPEAFEKIDDFKSKFKIS